MVKAGHGGWGRDGGQVGRVEGLGTRWAEPSWAWPRPKEAEEEE